MSERIEFKAAFAVDDAGSITGTAWPFGTPDRVGDVIEKGAFGTPTKLPMLFAHDQAQAIGVWESIAETDAGLTVKGRLLIDDVERAREVRALVREGAVSGLSIGFVSQKATARARGGRTISKLDLHEISIVAVPCHPGATITSMKAATDGPATEQESNMEPAVNTETKETPAVDQKAFDALQARLDKLEAKGNRLPASNDNQANDNLERKALAAFVRTGDAVELKAAATDNDPAGGYFVLPTVDTTIRTLLTDLSPLRELAEVVTITGGSYERFYSMGRRGAQWVTERGDRPQDTARPSLIKHSYGVAEMWAAPTTTRQMLDDASFDVAGWLINNAIHDFAETEGEAFLSGDNVDNSPKGLLTYDTTPEKDFTRAWGTFQFVPVGHANAPTDKQLSDNILRLVTALRRPYKASAVFLMNSNTALRLRQIVDGNGRYLWAPTGNLIEGVEHPLFGYRVVIDEGMPDIGAGTHPIAFGDFRQGYVIVDRQGIRTEQDSVTQKGRVVIDTYKRVGGGAGDFNAIKFLKIAA
jgi:HK97 family phage major capsid protein/HK97 family phage prohead protease